MDTFRELCRLRSTLEAFAALRLGTHEEKEKVLHRLRTHLKKLQGHAQKGRYEDFHQADMAFHRELVTSCPVPTLLESWEATVKQLDVPILQVKKEYWPSLMALYREHLFLFEAWQSPDHSVVEKATHHHLEVGWYRSGLASGKIPQEGGAVDRVASFLSIHYAGKIELEWVARNIGFVSLRHLTRLFGQQMKVSPHAWLRQIRLERAAQLLTAGGEEVARVGRRVGYTNASHFTRDFREKFGATPKAFRKRARETR